jgi:hypothetical protein
LEQDIGGEVYKKIFFEIFAVECYLDGNLDFHFDNRSFPHKDSCKSIFVGTSVASGRLSDASLIQQIQQ